MKKSFWRRRLWLGALLLIPLVLVMIFASLRAPVLQGSTYSRAPSGYGAWYADIQRQGIAVKRWQRPARGVVECAVSTERERGGVAWR